MRIHTMEHSIESQQKSVGFRLVGTFLGGILVLNSFISGYIFKLPAEVASLSAMLGAVMLGVPVIIESAVSLWRGKLHMQELVALAIIACFALEDYQTAGVVAFIMLGAELVQHRTALGAHAAIEGLIRLTPQTARKIDSGGNIIEIQVSNLNEKDIIQVLAGDNIAVDGIIKKGEATINQAAITGESVPVEKKEGDKVFAGTINLDGKIEVEVTRCGEDTTLGKVRHLIMEAEQTKVPIMRIIDQYISWYTPIIVMIAGIILYFTRDMNRAITALVVTCPCALILATPTAIVAALSCAARLGILVKNARHIEVASNITAVVFDKTGTLTTGELSVTRISPVDGSEDAAVDLLAVAGSLAVYSNHPVSKAVVKVAKEANVKLKQSDNIIEKAGMGAKGVICGETVFLGKKEWLEQNNILVDGAGDDDKHGLSVLYVGVGKKYAGWIGLEDKPRKEAKLATSELYQMGVKKIIMLTGDRESVAQKVASELGCEDYRAQCLPEMKLDVVNGLKKNGYCVGVIGDGINDAPALAAGDIGIAMGAAGSDIAIHSASVSLMNNDLLRLPFIIKISRKTRVVIYQNLVFGLVFIILGLIVSGFGYISPIVAALLHNAGSLVVIFNSARLVRLGEDLNS